MVKVQKIRIRDDFKITVPTLEEQYKDAVSFEGIAELPPVGLEVQTSVDNCNSVFSVSAALDTVTLPTVDIYIRNPYCRLGEPPQETKPFPVSSPASLDSSCNSSTFVLAFVENAISEISGDRHRYQDNANCLFFQESNIHVLEWDYSNDAPLGNYNGIDYYFKAEWVCKVDYRFNSNWANSFFTSGSVEDWEGLGAAYADEGWNVPADYLTNNRAVFTYKKDINVITYFDISRNATHVVNEEEREFIQYYPAVQFMDVERYQELLVAVYNPSVFTSPNGFGTLYAPAPENNLIIDSVFGNRSMTLTDSGIDDFSGIPYFVYAGIYRTVDFQKPKFLCATGTYPPPEPPGKNPPPPPPPMSCCPNVKENDALLKLILKRIGTPLNVNIRDFDETTKDYQPQTVNQNTLFNAARINTDRVEVANDLIGISEYPITAPRTIVEDFLLDYPETIDDLWGIYEEANETVELKSLTQFINWQVEQESAVMGGWHQIIQYQKDGKTEVVRLVNIAETLKELILLQAGQNRDNSLIVDLCLRLLTEILQIKGNVIRTNYICEDIQDYLDYPTQEKVIDYPISVSTPEPGKSLEENESITRLLRPSTMQVKFSDWTGYNSLHDKLLELLQAAATIRGVSTESGEELINYFKGGDAPSPTDGADDWQ
ncbi:hypothetical protein NIES4101_46250 [Calothrix sp. NIES-4101]|nr:hypothetical protein NIES4101_46250 [Calothrix sp. NIES-4101]